MAPPADRPRLQAVDALRVLAILAVIAIHTTPFEAAGSPIGRSFDAATLLNQATRFAVPFFLVVSGWFWAQQVAREGGAVGAPTRRLVRRAMLVWLAWSLVYLLPVNLFDALAQGPLVPLKVIYWNAAQVMKRPALALLEGTSPHLWFLVALSLCALLAAACTHLRARWALAVLAVGLYLIGLAGQSYPRAPFGFAIDPSFRNGHLYALAFFATGVALQRRGPSAAWGPLGAALAAIGFVLHLLELWLSHRWWGMPLERDYMAGTYLFGVGVALMGLAEVRALRWRLWQRLAALGPWVLGIYAAHMVFVGLLKPLDRRLTGSPLWELAYVALVFALSYALTRLLAHWPRTRPIVT